MNEITIPDYITTELKKFNIADADIAQMRLNYEKCSIQGIEDKQGYKIVKAARLHVKSKRVEVEKRRKELGADALKFQRAVNEEAKRITALLSPIEIDLEAKEVAHEHEIEAIRLAKEKEQQAILHGRIARITAQGFSLDPITLAYVPNFPVDAKEHICPTVSELSTLTDSEFNAWELRADYLRMEHQIKEAEQLADEQRQRDAEAEYQRQVAEQCRRDEENKLALQAQRLRAETEELEIAKQALEEKEAKLEIAINEFQRIEDERLNKPDYPDRVVGQELFIPDPRFPETIHEIPVHNHNFDAVKDVELPNFKIIKPELDFKTLNIFVDGVEKEVNAIGLLREFMNEHPDQTPLITRDQHSLTFTFKE